MPRAFAVNALCCVVVGVVLMAAIGCRGPQPRVATAPSDQALSLAVRQGAQALADMRREHVLAQSEKRRADYTAARDAMAKALNAMRPDEASLAVLLDYEQIALNFDTALAAMDAVIAADKKGDPQAELAGWMALDLSVEALVPLLAPHASKQALLPALPAAGEKSAPGFTGEIGVAPLDVSKDSTHKVGRWEYRFRITAPGSRSEGSIGELLFDGARVPDGVATGDFYATPWGPIQWVGNKSVMWGAHGWMPRPEGVTAGRELAAPWRAGDIPVVQAMVLRENATAAGSTMPEAWVVSEIGKLGANSFALERNWFPVTHHALTLHDTKMLGVLIVRMAPPRDADKLTVIIDGSDPVRVDLDRKDGARAVVRRTLDSGVARENFYLAFRVDRAAPDCPKPLDVGPEMDGKTVVVKDVREVIIALPGDRNSGCAWNVKSIAGDAPLGTSVFALGGAEFTPGMTDAERAARAGVFETRFRVAQKGKSVVTLEYRRPWQKDAPAEKTFTVTLDVQ